MDKGTLALVAAIGALIGVGQLMISHDTITLRKSLGRAIVTAGLAVGAFASLTLFPSLPEQAIVGLACLLASFGTSGLEMFVLKYMESKGASPAPIVLSPPTSISEAKEAVDGGK